MVIGELGLARDLWLLGLLLVPLAGLLVEAARGALFDRSRFGSGASKSGVERPSATEVDGVRWRSWPWLPVVTGAAQAGAASGFLFSPHTHWQGFPWLQAGSVSISAGLLITPFSARTLATLAYLSTIFAFGHACGLRFPGSDGQTPCRDRTPLRILALQFLIAALLLADSLGGWLLSWSLLQFTLAAYLQQDGEATAARRLALTCVMTSGVALFGLTQLWMVSHAVSWDHLMIALSAAAATSSAPGPSVASPERIADIMEQMQSVTGLVVVSVCGGCAVFPFSAWLQPNREAVRAGFPTTQPDVRQTGRDVTSVYPRTPSDLAGDRCSTLSLLLVGLVMPAGLVFMFQRVPAAVIMSDQTGWLVTAIVWTAALGSVVLALTALTQPARCPALRFLAASQSSLIVAASLASGLSGLHGPLAVWTVLACALPACAMASDPVFVGIRRGVFLRRGVLALAALTWLAGGLWLMTSLSPAVHPDTADSAAEIEREPQTAAVETTPRTELGSASRRLNTAGPSTWLRLLVLLQGSLGTACLIQVCLKAFSDRSQSGAESAAPKDVPVVGDGNTQVSGALGALSAVGMLTGVPVMLAPDVLRGNLSAWFIIPRHADVLAALAPGMGALLLGASLGVLCGRPRSVATGARGMPPSRLTVWARRQLGLIELGNLLILKPLRVSVRVLAGIVWAIADWVPMWFAERVDHLSEVWSRSITTGSRLWYLLALMLGLAVLLQLLTW